jgi:hypothetical protein
MPMLSFAKVKEKHGCDRLPQNALGCTSLLNNIHVQAVAATVRPLLDGMEASVY